MKRKRTLTYAKDVEGSNNELTTYCYTIIEMQDGRILITVLDQATGEMSTHDDDHYMIERARRALDTRTDTVVH